MIKQKEKENMENKALNVDGRKSFENTFSTLDFDPSFTYFQQNRESNTTLEWSNISYSIRKKQILNKVSGRVESGEVTALMGSSGAGKTSLMNVLAGRVVTNGKKKVKGTILVNGVLSDPKEYRRKVAYVMQDDVLFATATVKESLDFSARLRLEPETANDNIKRSEIVNDLLDSLGLTEIQDSVVGSVFLRGVSGGERKRVAIGIELVTNPKLLFLDEPTSGLDSFNAWKVIKILQNLGKATGCCCLCTIHQPSSEVFNEFENVLVLSKGSVMYNGTVSDLPEIMKLLGKPIPSLTNPADYIMLLAQTVYDDDFLRFNLYTGESKPEIEWEYSTMLRHDSLKAQLDKPSLKEKVIKSSFIVQVSNLTKREFKALYRDPSIFKSSILARLITNLVVGGVFFQALDRNEEKFSVPVGISALLFAYAGIFMGSFNPQIIYFPLERGLMVREYQTGTYGSVSYLCSKIIVDIPKVLLEASAAVVVIYFMMGMQANVLLVILLGTLTGVTSSGFGQILGASLSDAKAAQEFGPLLLFPQLLFSGVFIPIDNLPPALSWLQYISIMKYAASAGAVIEFNECGDRDDLDNLFLEVTTCNSSQDNCLNLEENLEYQQECIESLENQNMSKEDLIFYIGMLVVLAIVFRCSSLIVLVYRANFFTD
eukprot:maker-scaffold_48-snap-gene-1.43-mRNA-1 protein AED:0.30 eAED:0.30 QI:5/1/1/1/1/1/2/79/656